MNEDTRMILEKLDVLDHRITEVQASLDAKIDNGLASLDAKIDNGLASLDAKIDNGLASLDAKIDNVQQSLDERITNIQLTLENVTNKNIQIIAEGHLDLSRKLDEALKVEREKEILLLRVNRLENDMRQVKKSVGLFA